jgi:hypothetical protein
MRIIWVLLEVPLLSPVNRYLICWLQRLLNNSNFASGLENDCEKVGYALLFFSYVTVQLPCDRGRPLLHCRNKGVPTGEAAGARRARPQGRPSRMLRPGLPAQLHAASGTLVSYQCPSRRTRDPRVLLFGNMRRGAARPASRRPGHRRERHPACKAGFRACFIPGATVTRSGRPYRFALVGT